MTNLHENDKQTDKQRVYEQAAEWYMLMQEQILTEAQQTEFDIWLATSALHQEVWKNVTMFDAKFQRMPKHVVAKTVQELKLQNKPTGKLSLAFISILAALYAYQSIRQQDFLPEILSFDPIDIYKTEIGQQQQIALADGSQIWLNSGTKIRVKYNDQQRRIDLTKGEIYIETAKDQMQRRFSVNTKHGDLLALGTVFNVYYTPERTILQVKEGAVRIETANHKKRQDIAAQHAAAFDDQQIYSAAYQATNLLWREQLFVVHSMSLKQFTAELSRYHKAKIIIDPALDHIAVSGSYSLLNIEKTLAMVAQTHHLKMNVDMQGNIQLTQ